MILPLTASASTTTALRLRRMTFPMCRSEKSRVALPICTASLIFQKGTPTKSVWFYDLTADGFSLDDNRTPIEANDIPDVLSKWPNREEGANSYQVPIEKIKENRSEERRVGKECRSR